MNSEQNYQDKELFYFGNVSPKKKFITTITVNSKSCQNIKLTQNKKIDKKIDKMNDQKHDSIL